VINVGCYLIFSLLHKVKCTILLSLNNTVAHGRKWDSNNEGQDIIPFNNLYKKEISAILRWVESGTSSKLTIVGLLSVFDILLYNPIKRISLRILSSPSVCLKVLGFH